MFVFGVDLLEILPPDDPACGGSARKTYFRGAAYLVPRAEAALRQELQRLVDAAKRARLVQRSSSSGSRAI
jgi:hypothetical protein